MHFSARKNTHTKAYYSHYIKTSDAAVLENIGWISLHT